jgi:hypothetical protein
MEDHFSTNVTFQMLHTVWDSQSFQNGSVLLSALLLTLENEIWLLTVESEATLERQSKQRTKKSKGLAFGISKQ